MQVNPGNFDKKIEIIKNILTKDKDGFEIKTEEIILKTWAQITNKSGGEAEAENSDFVFIKTRFLIRTPKLSIDKDYKIKFRGKTYDIAYINDYNFDGLYTEIITNEVIK